jgi:hypothetical protein
MILNGREDRKLGTYRLWLNVAMTWPEAEAGHIFWLTRQSPNHGKSRFHESQSNLDRSPSRLISCNHGCDHTL